jgi:hypothetical protein
MVARYLPFAGYRIDIASVNAGFTVMLGAQPFGQAGDSIMNIRDANKADAQTCGRILYDAFKKLAEQHNCPPDFPSPEVAAGLTSMLIGDPGFYGVVAEEGGTIVGSNRDRELRDAIRARSASVVEHLEEITGYATAIAIFAHAVARTKQDLKALIGAATEFSGPGFLLPTRNHDVFAWCLNCELKLVFQMTLMTTGLYNEPAGAYLPSILY